VGDVEHGVVAAALLEVDDSADVVVGDQDVVDPQIAVRTWWMRATSSPSSATALVGRWPASSRVRPAGVRGRARETGLTGVGQLGTLDGVYRLFPITPPPRA
jgi:hypothetical protein